MPQRFILSVLLLIFCACVVFFQAGRVTDAGLSSKARGGAVNGQVNGATQETENGQANNAASTTENEQVNGMTSTTDDGQVNGATSTTNGQVNGMTPPSFLIGGQPGQPNRPSGGLIGLNDIIFQPDDFGEAPLVVENAVMDFDFLMTNIFLAQPGTGILPSDVNADKLMAEDISLRGQNGPKVLIFHTHSTEMYADSAPGDPMEGIMGVGRYLASLLTDKYGIETLHHTGRYDMVNGTARIPGAYERMEPEILRVLKENPSVEVLLDLHRDGLNPGVPPMVEDVNGKRTARIMFVNGMCRVNENGVIKDAPGLENPYVFENLALSFQAQLKANELFPGFARRVYMKPYRYSLHMSPKSMLVEMGAQNNTKREAFNAAEALGELLARVLA